MTERKKNFLSALPGWQHSFAARLSWIFMLILMVLALFGPYIANEKPYYCKLDGKSYFPVFSGISESTLSQRHPDHSPVNWYTTNFESVWYSPVPYSYHTIDLKTGTVVSPFDVQEKNLRLRHWLGTDLSGRDVLAGMIRGCRVSLLIGLGSMLLALLIGAPLGSMAAYFGNRQLRVSLIGIMLLAFWLLICIYLGMIMSLTSFLIIASIGIVFFLLLIHFLNARTKKISIPLDHGVMGMVSIIDGFPALFIVLIILFIIPLKGWLVIMGAIALLRWPVMARYMRAEVFKMQENNYIKAAQVLNLPHSYILSHHVVPYAFRPVMISFIFGVSSAILAESSLSFLGIGLPPEELNWGRLLSQSRNHFEAWWLVVFPGAAIFFTLLSLYMIGISAQKQYSQSEL